MVPPPKTEKDEKAIAYARSSLKNVPWCEAYEKMVSGMLYDSFGPELTAGRLRARRLAQEYNVWVPTAEMAEPEIIDLRAKRIHELFGKVGSGVYIEPAIQVDYGCNITVGDQFYANFNCIFLDCAQITIGNRVLFATGVSLITATHETSLQSRRDNIEYAEPIVIGDDCWLAANVTVLPGVTIGKGCTIGAGSVVSKSIPDYSVAIGVPARVIRKVDPID